MPGARETELLTRLEQLNGQLVRQLEETRRGSAATDDRRAAAARSGEMGEDWQVVQRRIDAGDTTLQAVFGGQDETPAARRLLGLAQQNIAQAAADLPPELEQELAEEEAEHDLLVRRAQGLA